MEGKAIGRLSIPLVAALCTLPARAVTILSHEVSTPAAGITIDKMRTSSPSTWSWAAIVDLCNPHVRVDATGPPSGTRTAGSFGNAVGATLVINADFYNFMPRPAYKTSPFVSGDAVGGGVHWPVAHTGASDDYVWYHRHYGWIAVGPDWVNFTHSGHVKANRSAFNGAGYSVAAGFRPTELTYDIPANTQALVSGWPALVIEGTKYICDDPAPYGSYHDGDPPNLCFSDRGDMSLRNPRTAMGVSQDLRTLYLVVVDGRSGSSAGMYGWELADLMHQIGAWQAYNLDGGGSTQMWLSGSGYLNNPSDGSARSVANHLAVFSDPGSTTAAHCADNNCTPVDEICGNGRDDDCDGSIDEQEGSEVCFDGVDNNCNGQIDEGCVCQENDTQPCGSAVGACAPGVQTCSGQAWGACQNAVGPTTEVCNGADDNCDGNVDEGVKNACGSCGAVPAELCNGLDDDCDGLRDEDCACVHLATEGCGSNEGACQMGVRTCQAGVWSPCVGEIEPVSEACDGVDNDCDGIVDELSVCGTDAGPGGTGLDGSSAVGDPVTADNGCGCRSGVTRAEWKWLLLVVVVLRRRRRQR